MKLNRDKCEFRKSSISYVGHVLTGLGVKPDPEKVRAVKEMPPPTNVKELQTLLGFVQYLAIHRKHVRNYCATQTVV